MASNGPGTAVASASDGSATEKKGKDGNISPARARKLLANNTSSLSLYRRFDDRPATGAPEETYDEPCGLENSDDDSDGSGDLPVLLAPTGTSIRAERGSLAPRLPPKTAADESSSSSSDHAADDLKSKENEQTEETPQKLAASPVAPVGSGAAAAGAGSSSGAVAASLSQQSGQISGSSVGEGAPAVLVTKKTPPTIRPPQIPPANMPRSFLDTSKIAPSNGVSSASKGSATSAAAPSASAAPRAQAQASNSAAGARVSSGTPPTIRQPANKPSSGIPSGSGTPQAPKSNPVVRPPQNRAPPKIRPPQVRGPPPGAPPVHNKPSMATVLAKDYQGMETESDPTSSLAELAADLSIKNPNEPGAHLLTERKSDPGKRDQKRNFQGFGSLKRDVLRKEHSASSRGGGGKDKDTVSSASAQHAPIDILEVQRLVYEQELIRNQATAGGTVRVPPKPQVQTPTSGSTNTGAYSGMKTGSNESVSDEVSSERRISEPDLPPFPRGGSAQPTSTAPARRGAGEDFHRHMDPRSASAGIDPADSVLDSLSMKVRAKGFRRVPRRY